jgi:O-antigen ligase
VKHRQLKLTDYGPAPGGIDAAVEWLLVALLAFMPLAFGAVEPWSEFVATAAALGLAVLLVVRRFARRDVPAEWTWAYVPVVLYLLLAATQLLALPSSLVRAVSPETVAAKARLLADLPNAAGALQRISLSFYPAATRHDLRVVLIAVTIFAAVVEVYRRPEQVRRLLAAVAGIGGVVIALGLAQRLGGAGAIYWSVPTPSGTADAGPFVNHNHYAQFLNLSIGAALGMLVVKVRELNLRHEWSRGDVAAALREPEARAVWFYAAVVVAGVVAVFLSMSRGGMIGMLVAAVFATVGLGRRQHLRHTGWALVLLMLVAFVGVLYLGFDAVYDRLAAIHRQEDATGGRWQIVQDVVGVWRQYPVAGTGLGTHAFVFPQYDRTGAPLLAEYVENEYVQALEETGALGLALVLAFVAMVWFHFARAARAHRPRVAVAAFGLGYALLAVMVQSVTDFGQHIPAVAGLSAVTCGLIISLSRLARHAKVAEAAAEEEARKAPDAPPPAVAVVRPTPRRFAVPFAVAAMMAWAVVGADESRRADEGAREAERVAAYLADNGWQGGDEDYTRLLENASSASEIEPDRVEHRYWLNTYRWRSLSRERDPNTGDLLVTADTLDFTRRIVNELQAARPLCPTYGPLVSLAGQLELFVLEEPAGLARIRTGYRLAPNHPDVVFSAAMADASAGEFDPAVDKFKRACRLSPPLLAEAVDQFENQFDRPDLALAVARDGDDPTVLLLFSQRLAKKNQLQLAGEARAAGIRTLVERCARVRPVPQDLAALAGIYRDEKNPEGAIELYRRALALEYGQVEWRLSLARVLADVGRSTEALREAEICLRQRPGDPDAQRLVGELTLRAPTSATSDTLPRRVMTAR